MSEFTCLHCEEPVLPEERSQVSYFLNAEGTVENRRTHWECQARSVIGSVGHQLGMCSCQGGTFEDPQGLSKRDAARAAYKLAQLVEHR